MMFPFDDPFDADIFNDDYNDDEDTIARRKEIAGIMIEDMLSKEQGNEVAPDTTGVDYFFLTDFITEDMGMDFAIIEQDFLDKCRGRLKEFNEVGWNGDVSFRLRSPLDINKYEEDRAELIALREYAYKSEHDEPVSEDAIPDMKSAIAEKNVVIIGGHVNWQNKLKALFPNWMFIAPDAYKTVDGKMLENKDMVYFYTDYINHISYKKFIAAVRERKISFGYLGSNNVDNVVNQIYGDLCS